MDSQSEIEDIFCNMCLKEFESNLQLKSHLMKQHKEDPVSCEECDKELINKYALRSHMQSHEFDQRKVCNKRMKAKSLPTHMDIKKSSNNYAFEECNVNYTRKASLVRHMKGYTETKTPYGTYEGS